MNDFFFNRFHNKSIQSNLTTTQSCKTPDDSTTFAQFGDTVGEQEEAKPSSATEEHTIGK